ncbi:glycosyltransferase [Micromonospora carbonacea]|uniref:Glycosyltransferase family 1 protein n=1 Tax=Micromonospora carbonacea TaxID=47853 RepID=A0A7H8XJ54_9ACTN|nr:glycosyltransferase [Micromonospora carbonacea]MBB5828888.1 polyene glycosyltransferase [Micromonospora carbonacea]QLD23571.1 glycosyltransferase family 1 protein [Micromonospora carbonacea]
MRSVLFASPAHPGQLNPLLAIAGELSRRGEPGLWFAAEEEARDRVAAHATGSPLRFRSTGDTVLRVDDELYAAMTRGPMTTAGLVALARQIRIPEVADRVRARTLEQIDEIRPSLMVIDMLNLGALDAALARGVPYVLSLAFPPSNVYLSRLPWDYPTPTSGLPRRLGPRQRWTNLTFRARLRLSLLRALAGQARHRRAQRIDNAFGDPEKYSAAATAVFGYTVFGLEYPFPAPEHLHLFGPMVPLRDPAPGESPSGGPGQGGELTGWLDRQTSVVYACLGTLARLTGPQVRAFAEALAAIGPEHQVLWKLPAAQRHLLPGPLPPHVRIEEWIPSQLDVLAHPNVRAFVCHGGANGFHEGVHFGQPMLMTPFWLDCYDVAARAVDVGVGLALDRPPHVDASEVAGKLRRLLTEESFRERSRHWGEQCRRAGGVGRAADLVLKLAASH